MSKKIHYILLTLLVIQLALIFIVYRPQEENQQTFTFFDTMKADSINKITINDEQGMVILSKEKNNRWIVKNDMNNVPYPADSVQCETLLEKLLLLQSNRLITKTPSSHYRLEVAETKFSRKIVLDTKSGQLPTLFFGSSADFQSVHARLEEDNNVYAVKEISTWQLPTGIDSWWNTNFLNIEPDTLIEVQLQNQHGTINLHKEQDNNWHMNGFQPSLEGKTLDDFLQQVTHMKLEKYLTGTESEPVISNPAATLILKTKEKDITIHIATKEENETSHKASSSDFRHHVSLNAYIVEPLLLWKKEDFRNKPKEKILNVE